MSTPVPPSRRPGKYKGSQSRCNGPTSCWNTTLKLQVPVKNRAKAFKSRGYRCVKVRPGELHATSLLQATDGSPKEVFVGSRMPFEVAAPRRNHFELCIHELRKNNGVKTARVNMFLPGATVIEFTQSSNIAAPVLGLSASPSRGSHLQTICSGDFKAAQDIIACAGGAGLTLTAAAIIQTNAAGSISRRKAGRPLCVVLPFHNAEQKWTCLTCSSMFATAAELAKHDGVHNIGSPRCLKLTGQLGEPFRMPRFHGSQSWKANALDMIEAGNVDKAMLMAPTMKRKDSRAYLTSALAKVQTESLRRL